MLRMMSFVECFFFFVFLYALSLCLSLQSLLLMQLCRNYNLKHSCNEVFGASVLSPSSTTFLNYAAILPPLWCEGFPGGECGICWENEVAGSVVDFGSSVGLGYGRWGLLTRVWVLQCRGNGSLFSECLDCPGSLGRELGQNAVEVLEIQQLTLCACRLIGDFYQRRDGGSVFHEYREQDRVLFWRWGCVAMDRLRNDRSEFVKLPSLRRRR